MAFNDFAFSTSLGVLITSLCTLLRQRCIMNEDSFNKNEKKNYKSK